MIEGLLLGDNPLEGAVFPQQILLLQ